MTLIDKLDALALLDYAAHQEGELGGDAWWDCAMAAMRVLPELLAVVRAADKAHYLMDPDARPRDDAHICGGCWVSWPCPVGAPLDALEAKL